ncbi:MAG: SDR family oxidoreductase [Myxococcota bacterium]|nr:SDR family oxidoreductase [Myxococcota bacterium]
MGVTIDGSTVLITGASSGIGAAVARVLAPRAALLILVARRRHRLLALKDELLNAHPALKVDVYECDLSQVANARQLAHTVLTDHQAVDLLINNAGLGQIGPLHAADPTHLDTMLGVNILGLTGLTHALLPSMVDRKQGAILNVSSGFGLIWSPFFAAYVGSKHYLTAFSESLRSELAGTGVTVCQVCPGPVATEFEEKAGSPLPPSVPIPMQLSSQSVARQMIRALEANRALFVPGFLAWIGIHLGRLVPRVLQRVALRVVVPFIRRRLFPDGSSMGHRGSAD